VAISAVDWGLNHKAGSIVYDISQLSLVASCIVLILAIYRLVRLSSSLTKKVVNRGMIIMHIIAYLLIIFVNVQTTVIHAPHWRKFEIAWICNFAVQSVCSVIFCLIVHQLATKILAITAYSDSLTRSLVNEAASTDQVNQTTHTVSTTQEP